MTRPDALTVSRALVAERFPSAEQAWLGGSVVMGSATSTSDLDITVLDESEVVHRESLLHDGWPVELFVHGDASIRHFVAQDVAHRRPTMARLLAQGVPLLPGDGGAAIRTHCEQVLEDGPDALSAEDVDAARYALSDLVDDLRASTPGPVGTAIALEAWRRTADLVLAANQHWSGGGKWLIRELIELDDAAESSWAVTLDTALRAALAGDDSALVAVVDDALNLVGGRLWQGFRQDAALPTGPR